MAASFSVEGSAPGGTGTRYVFTGWTGDSTASSADSTIAMDGPKTVSASWRTDHLLTIVSAYGVAEGAGWYAENTAATASVPDRVTANGTTYRFAGWTGASTSSSSVTLVTMDGPKALTATWVVVPPETPSTSPGLGVLPWIALVVIAVIAFLFLFIWYRRRRKEDESRPPPTA